GCTRLVAASAGESLDRGGDASVRVGHALFPHARGTADPGRHAGGRAQHAALAELALDPAGQLHGETDGGRPEPHAAIDGKDGPAGADTRACTSTAARCLDAAVPGSNDSKRGAWAITGPGEADCRAQAFGDADF